MRAREDSSLVYLHGHARDVLVRHRGFERSCEGLHDLAVLVHVVLDEAVKEDESNEAALDARGLLEHGQDLGLHLLVMAERIGEGRLRGALRDNNHAVADEGGCGLRQCAVKTTGVGLGMRVAGAATGTQDLCEVAQTDEAMLRGHAGPNPGLRVWRTAGWGTHNTVEEHELGDVRVDRVEVGDGSLGDAHAQDGTELAQAERSDGVGELRHWGLRLFALLILVRVDVHVDVRIVATIEGVSSVVELLAEANDKCSEPLGRGLESCDGDCLQCWQTSEVERLYDFEKESVAVGPKYTRGDRLACLGGDEARRGTLGRRLAGHLLDEVADELTKFCRCCLWVSIACNAEGLEDGGEDRVHGWVRSPRRSTRKYCLPNVLQHRRGDEFSFAHGRELTADVVAHDGPQENSEAHALGGPVARRDGGGEVGIAQGHAEGLNVLALLLREQTAQQLCGPDAGDGALLEGRAERSDTRTRGVDVKGIANLTVRNQRADQEARARENRRWLHPLELFRCVAADDALQQGTDLVHDSVNRREAAQQRTEGDAMRDGAVHDARKDAQHDTVHAVANKLALARLLGCHEGRHEPVEGLAHVLKVREETQFVDQRNHSLAIGELLLQGRRRGVVGGLDLFVKRECLGVDCLVHFVARDKRAEPHVVPGGGGRERRVGLVEEGAVLSNVGRRVGHVVDGARRAQVQEVEQHRGCTLQGLSLCVLEEGAGGEGKHVLLRVLLRG
eukprot:PhM_4_TR17172/c0_g1_i1/m.22898